MAERNVAINVTGKVQSLVKSMGEADKAVEKTATGMSGHFTKATSHVGGLFNMLDTQLGQFGIPFTGVLGHIGDKMKEMESKGSSAVSKIGSIAGQGALAIGAVAVAAGVEAIHMADDFEKQHANLRNSIENSGHKFSEFSKIVEAQQAPFAKLGINAIDYEKALTKLVTSTQDPKKAIQDMGIVADVAAKWHLDLEKAATVVGLAMEGNTKKLKMLLPDLNLAAGSAKDLAKAHDGVTKAEEALALVEEHIHQGRLKGVSAADSLKKAHENLAGAEAKLESASNGGASALDALSTRAMGASAAQAETFQGKMKGLTAELENVAIKIGLKLIPIVQKMGVYLMQAVTWVQAHREDFKRFFEDVRVAVEKMWTFVEPIYKAIWEQLQNIFQLVDDLIHGNWSKIWDDFVGILDGAVNLLAAPFVGMYHLFQSTFDNIATAASTAVDDVINFFRDLPGNILGALGDLGGLLLGAGDDLLKGLTGGAKAAWNGFADFWDGLSIHVPGIDIPLVGEVGNFDVRLPHLPHLASGTRNFPGGLAWVGERGPELVGLPRGSSVYTNAESQAMASGGHVIHVNVQSNADPYKIASEVGWALRVA